MRLYVSGLPYATTEDELTAVFDDHGTVESVNIITERETGKSRGFGFVDMPNDEEAKNAISALNGEQFGGRTLNVDEARERRR